MFAANPFGFPYFGQAYAGAPGDLASGTVSLAGSFTESYETSSTTAATITLGGSGSDVYSQGDSQAGTVTLGGSASETSSPGDAGNAVITLTGSFVESITSPDSTSGTISLSGTGAGPFHTPFGVSLAFNDNTLEPSPTWTRLDNGVTRVASYTIDRGRQFELDRTDGGRATVTINDIDGTLDPTNATGPYYGLIQPLIQAAIARWNPVLQEWQTRFRGFVEDFTYEFNPAAYVDAQGHTVGVNQLTISLVDIFEILNAIEMLPGEFGDPPPSESAGQVFFEDTSGPASDRILQVLQNAGIPVSWYVVFSLNVSVQETVYSPGESAMTPIQEAVDAEFPGVANAYTDRFGRLAVHGRLAKFSPASVAAGAGDSTWDWHHWHAGDGAAVAASPSTTAQIRQFAFTRGLAQVINSATATPINIADADVAGQTCLDSVSIGTFGIRSWSAQNLLTKTGLLDGSDDLTETKRFAQYHVDNYAEPRNRVTQIAFRPIRPTQTGAAINWRLLCEVDISDQIDITIASPGGGGFNAEPFFVEGIHESVVGRINTDGQSYDDVTITLDVSPQAYFTDSTNLFPT